MRVLVTGGAGFIGSHLVRKLLTMNHEVTVVDDLSHGLRSSVPDGAGFILLDINSPLLGEIVSRGNFDCIIHLAAQTRVDISMKFPADDVRCNVMGTVNLLECAGKCGVRRIIFASSAAVYGDPPVSCLPIEEGQPLRPLSYYGLGKAAAEAYLELHHRCFGLEYIVLRFANVYGERVNIHDEGGVINVFTRRAVRHEPIVIFGSGAQSRDYIYVGDIVNGIIAAMESSHANSVYNLSTEQAASLHDVVHLLEAVSGSALCPVYQPARQGDIACSLLSCQKARKELAWKPQMTLENGIGQLYAYYSAHERESR